MRKNLKSNPFNLCGSDLQLHDSCMQDGRLVKQKQGFVMVIVNNLFSLKEGILTLSFGIMLLRHPKLL